MEKLIILKEFLQRHEAEMAKGLLEENGIDCVLETDDCGGLRAGMTFGSAIKLKVSSSDLEKAKDVVKVLENQEG